MKKIIMFVLAVLVLASVISAADARVIVRDKSVVKVGEDINMGSDMSFQDLVTFKGNINVKGNVAGDVVAVLGNIHLFPTAKVAGDTVAVGGIITTDKGAAVKGEITELAVNKEVVNMAATCAPVVGIMGIGGFLVLKALVLLGFIGLAAILVSFMTPQLGTISSRIEKDWLKAFLWGLLGTLLILPIAFLLTITIIGIPLIIIELLLVSIAMTLGYIAMMQLVGKKFTKAIRKPNQPMLNEIIWGLILLFLVDLIPFAGGIIKGLLATTGFGAAIVTKLGYKR